MTDVAQNVSAETSLEVGQRSAPLADRDLDRSEDCEIGCTFDPANDPTSDLAFDDLDTFPPYDDFTAHDDRPRDDYRSHDYRSHDYRGHNYRGHNYRGHNHRAADDRLPYPSKVDALIALVQSALGGERAADHLEILVHLREDALGQPGAVELHDGTRIEPETFRRLACDAGLIAYRKDASGELLDVGRKTRAIPPAIRRALKLRDACCAFPGCTHDRWLDAHHIEHWIHGGETKLDNLLHLCTFHHQCLHEGGFTVEPAKETEGFLFRRPNGTPIEPPQPRIIEAGATAITQANRKANLAIDARTPMSGTHYTRNPDYRMCIEAGL